MNEEIYDIIIAGGGPGALTAGMYACRARLKTLLLDAEDPQSQLTLTYRVENYPGIPEGIDGASLIDIFRKQALLYGLTLLTDKVIKIEKKEDKWEIVSGKKKYHSQAVILAMGASPKMLNVPGEKEYRGKGVSYCATCDGPLFRNKNIVIVGGGDTAIEESMFLAKFAEKITLIHRRDKLRATKILQERALSNKKIEIIWDSVLKEIKGENRVTGVVAENVKTKKESQISCDGVFIFVGLTANTFFLKGLVDLDEWGYIIANQNMETSQRGIFACGDCIQKTFRQIITACGDGATAAFSAEKYIEEHQTSNFKHQNNFQIPNPKS